MLYLATAAVIAVAAGCAASDPGEVRTVIFELREGFGGEARDDEWATSQETAIAEALASATWLSDVEYECRATRCRVLMHDISEETVHSDEILALHLTIANAEGLRQQRYHHYDDETRIVEWYFSRTGYHVTTGEPIATE